MTLSLANFNYALKEMYPDIVGELNMLDYPLLTMLKKDTNFTGSKYVQPTIYANNAGRSGSLTVAQSAANGAKGVRFEITAIKDYGVIRVDGETLRASDGEMSRAEARSFLEARRGEIKSTTEALLQAAAHSIYRGGKGNRGQRASAAVNVITLSNPHDGIFFDVGMVVGAIDATLTTQRVGTTTVTAVTRGLTTTTVTLASAAAIAGFVDTDWLIVDGDFANPRISGLDAWVPSAAPGATPFFGVDRSVDPSRLGGLRTADAFPIVERLVRAEAFARIQGARLDVFCVHPIQMASIKNALGDKIRYVDLKSPDAKFSFKTVEIATMYGTVKLLDDPFCQTDIAWGLQLDTWKVISRGEMPGPLNHLGGAPGEFFTMTAEDSIEGRYGYYANLACNAPGYNVRVSLS